MSGIATATGIAGSTLLAGVGAAAAVASAAYSISAKGAKAAGDLALGRVSSAENQALSARSALLATAGASAGSPLAPGQVGNTVSTVFGN